MFFCTNSVFAHESARKDKDVLAENINIWQINASLGFDQYSGNTDIKRLNLNLHTNRKTFNNEFTFKQNSFYSSSAKKTDGQKFSAMIRYAFSFWKRKWYNYYKTAVEHDRFANINFRFVPSTGLGYWRFTGPDIKLMFEVGLGFEYSDFSIERKDTAEAVLIPGFFFERLLWNGFGFYNDTFFYPSLSSLGRVRIQSETGLKNSLNKRLSLWISLIDDYNSSPPGITRQNDFKVISGIKYDFQ